MTITQSTTGFWADRVVEIDSATSYAIPRHHRAETVIIDSSEVAVPVTITLPSYDPPAGTGHSRLGLEHRLPVIIRNAPSTPADGVDAEIKGAGASDTVLGVASFTLRPGKAVILIPWHLGDGSSEWTAWLGVVGD